MTLTQYIKALQKLEKEYGDVAVVTASDEEGNDYNQIQYVPKFFKKLEGNSGTHYNVVCVN